MKLIIENKYKKLIKGILLYKKIKQSIKYNLKNKECLCFSKLSTKGSINKLLKIKLIISLHFYSQYSNK
jgi:hypothetical protein